MKKFQRVGSRNEKVPEGRRQDRKSSFGFVPALIYVL
jgi:hypothetical protein